MDAIECREGFHGDSDSEGFYNVGECIDVYSTYWTYDAEASACFADTAAVEGCTTVLESLTCPADTPAECEAILECSAAANGDDADAE